MWQHVVCHLLSQVKYFPPYNRTTHPTPRSCVRCPVLNLRTWYTPQLEKKQACCANETHTAEAPSMGTHSVTWSQTFTRRTDHRFLLHELQQIFQGRQLPDLYHLVRDSGWEPCNLHDLGYVHWVGSALRRSCTNISQRQVGIYMIYLICTLYYMPVL